MQPDFNNEGGTFPSLSISISIDIAWLAHSAQPDSLEDKCLIFLRQVGVGAAAPVTDQAWQLFFRLPAVLVPDVACCRSPYL